MPHVGQLKNEKETTKSRGSGEKTTRTAVRTKRTGNIGYDQTSAQVQDVRNVNEPGQGSHKQSHTPTKGHDLAVNAESLHEFRNEEDFARILAILPERIKRHVGRLERKNDIVEIVLDLGRIPEIRFPDDQQDILGVPVSREDIDHVVSQLSAFGDDNRAGIARTLHRISAIRNRTGTIIGLTLRVGRAVEGTIDTVLDIIRSGQSILLLGRPGVGKTTMLRECARVLSEERKRVVVVDTSNEIAGDGDIPHDGIGRARRMPVPNSNMQHHVMIEAVENHMPQVIVIDEIGSEAETLAARTIAERGVQLIGTAHGQTLENLMANPSLSDLVGGITSVTLSDEEARRRNSRKTVLERKAPPTFDVVIEIRERDHFAIHTNLAETVDAILRGLEPKPEQRMREFTGGPTFIQPAQPAEETYEDMLEEVETTIPKSIFLYGISKDKMARSLESMGISATIVRHMDQADIIIALKQMQHKNSERLQSAINENVPVHFIKTNTVTQIKNLLATLFDVEIDDEEEAIREAEIAVHRVIAGEPVVELTPRSAYVRRIQHQMADEHGVDSESTGTEPKRRLRIFRDRTKVA